MSSITFKPKQVTKRLITVLPDRSRDVLNSRFGLGKNKNKMTLESIGTIYGVTRERVRQIENHALKSIAKSDVYGKEKSAFVELEELIHSLGGVVAEDDLLDFISGDSHTQNHVNFLLVLGDSFKRRKEDFEFKNRWYVDSNLAESVQNALRTISKGLSKEDLVHEDHITSTFLKEIKDLPGKHKKLDTVKRWLGLSKAVGQNPLGDWGLTASPNVSVKGMRDYAYLVIRKHGSPMHFSEVAKSIKRVFGKNAHVATCHNELIKDPRFVLVGRGLYALGEWGYSEGVVRDVVVEILKKNGALNKNDIIDLVLKERYVKPNTVVVNLQDSKLFRRAKDGKYTLA